MAIVPFSWHIIDHRRTRKNIHYNSFESFPPNESKFIWVGNRSKGILGEHYNELKVKSRTSSTSLSKGCYSCQWVEKSRISCYWDTELPSYSFQIPNGCICLWKRTSMTPTVIPTVAFCCSFNSFDIFGKYLCKKYVRDFSFLLYSIVGDCLSAILPSDWSIEVVSSQRRSDVALSKIRMWRPKTEKYLGGFFRICNGIHDSLLHPRVLFTYISTNQIKKIAAMPRISGSFSGEFFRMWRFGFWAVCRGPPQNLWSRARDV